MIIDSFFDELEKVSGDWANCLVAGIPKARQNPGSTLYVIGTGKWPYFHVIIKLKKNKGVIHFTTGGKKWGKENLGNLWFKGNWKKMDKERFDHIMDHHRIYYKRKF